MARPLQSTVKDTGAGYGDLLEGSDPHNKGLVLRILSDQEIGKGDRLQGEVEIVQAGSGPYARSLETFVGKGPKLAKEIINAVKHDHRKASHFLNANNLRLIQTSSENTNE